MDFDCVLTGDHSHSNLETKPVICAVSRAEERRKLFSKLPLAAQEALAPKVSFFDGKSDNAGKWLDETKEFALFNQMEMSFAFDMLLRGDCRLLWNEFSANRKDLSNEEVSRWFLATFTRPRSVVDKVKELSNVSQRHDERYQCFELRVRSLVTEIFKTPEAMDEIIKAFVVHGIHNDKLREAFILEPDMPSEKRLTMASMLEQLTPKSVAAVLPNRMRYSDAVRKPNMDNYQPRKMGFHQPQGRENKQLIMKNENSNNQPILANQQRNFPNESMKSIAKRYCYRAWGRQEPRPDLLKPGHCFCCGEAGHRRIDCPLNGRCLVCGKEGHNFRDCYKIHKSNRREATSQPILCIQEEEDLIEDITDFNDSDSNSEVQFGKQEKNGPQPTIAISSVGLHQ